MHFVLFYSNEPTLGELASSMRLTTVASRTIPSTANQSPDVNLNRYEN